MQQQELDALKTEYLKRGSLEKAALEVGTSRTNAYMAKKAGFQEVPYLALCREVSAQRITKQNRTVAELKSLRSQLEQLKAKLFELETER